LAELRAGLAAESAAAWTRIEDDVRARALAVTPGHGLEHAPGVRLVFHSVDPTSQRGHPLGRAIVVKAKDERFVMPIDDDLASRVAQLRDAQALFGWPIGREESWFVTGLITQTHQMEPMAVGDPSREHDVAVHDLYVPGQLMINAEREIPGLDRAMAALDALQAGVTVPASASPEAMVGVLVRVLATHHWRAFGMLADEELSSTDRRMAFEQFCQAWATSGDTIQLDSVEGDAAATEDGAVVRTRIRRTGQRGEALLRPLRWVRRASGWRYAGGIL